MKFINGPWNGEVRPFTAKAPAWLRAGEGRYVRVGATYVYSETELSRA